MNYRFTFHVDPAHGWLEAPRELLDDLGIEAQVSGYSYVKGGTVYLEEDCDAALLLDALKARGDDFEILTRHSDGDSFVRSLRRYERPARPITGTYVDAGGASRD